MITLSNDHTIRVWDVDNLEQTYEFPYPPNDPCLCISGNPNAMLFAAGFKSGTLRIIDIENVSVVE
jgi:WD40 repeat protein